MTQAQPDADSVSRQHPVFEPEILRGFHLLEADAGTGKTWTICGLAVRAVIERALPVDRILVVTFTRAATAELSRRIRERIETLAQAIERRIAGDAQPSGDPFCAAYLARIDDPAAALRRLRIALAQIDEAQVRTIHGFCHSVIDEHALSIGVARGLKAQALGSEWIERGIAAWWREALGDAPPGLVWLLRRAGVSPAALVAPVRSLDARPGAAVLPQAVDWRGVAAQLGALRAELAQALADETGALRSWVSVKGQVDGSRWRAGWVDSRVAALAGFCAGNTDRGAVIPDAVAYFTGDHFRGGKGVHPVPPLRLVGLCESLDALRPAAAAVASSTAREVVGWIGQRRLALKSQAGAIDHDDLLRLVRDALVREDSGPALAASLRDRYPLALIDECQDTDALQWEIFREIYSPGSKPDDAALILVGDPKQAIYAFRGADVYSYLDARSADPSRHALHENRRSVPALIEAVNALLERPRPFLVPEIGFAPSRAGATGRGALSETGERAHRAPMTVVTLTGDGAAGMIPKPKARALAVDACVGEIARLLGSAGARIDGRPLEPCDIAVLVNSHAEGSRIRSALAKAGIGAAEISRDSVLDSRECDDLLRVVAAIADPSDTGLLRSALATALIDRPDEALARSDATATVRAFALSRRRWSDAGPQAALARLFGELAVPERLARLRDGERRLTNVAHLLELLAASEQAREGAQPALRWLARMRDDPRALGEDVGELRLDSDEDLVRIVTVHKSKGLEYPIVFVPFAWSGRRFSARRDDDGSQPLTYHLPVAPAVPHSRPDAPGQHPRGAACDPGAAAQGPDEAVRGWTAVVDFVARPDTDGWLQAAREQHAESLRVLYVALTRAVHRCYLFWGAAAGAQFAPLAWLLHGLDPAQQSDWRANSKDAPALDAVLALDGVARWAQRANERSAGSVAVVGHDALAAAANGQGVAAAPRAPAQAASAAGGAPALVARAFDARIPEPWIRTSFSALADDLATGTGAAQAYARRAGELADHDQRSTAVASATGEGEGEAPPRTATVRFDFPAGARAGTCLHGILEDSDLSASLDQATVARWLARSGFDRALAPGVAAWLDEALDTPLPDLGDGPVSLRALAPQRQVREMEFLLAARDVDQRAVLDAIAAECPLEAGAAGARWSGYLRGFVDLVFEAGGRYYLLDWKSNRLGTRWEDYGPAALNASIAANAYSLQYCIYALALHRLLRLRLPNYAAQRHFGGVYYLFLRGVHPQRSDPDGRPLGVHAIRPGDALIERLDLLFGAQP